ncbi:MAG TPA: universal stress protein [Verrucomicrobiae bacterium]|jgi:universal stress protein A|nr:universal stress protein [Verrucomicrobiae bacterium]
MAFPYKTILCPVDFDENSLASLDAAIELAEHFGSSIILLYVLPMILTYGEASPAALLRDQDADAQAKLADIEKQKLGGVKHEAVVYTGDIIASILQAQADYHPDLLVMATHGRRGLSRMFLGSVAEAVVRKATCPVLTVRDEVPAAPAAAKKPAAAASTQSKSKRK